MRLERLDLSAWGCFTGVSIDLAGMDGGVHVLHGNNEAGKSTALRAIIALFFGVDHQTPDAHTHAMPDLRIGARLARDGDSIEVVRRKGTRNTLLDPDGQALDEALLRGWIGGISKEVFTAACGFDHERLRRSGEALARGAGDVGESLFGAGLGQAQVRDVLDRLEKEASDLLGRGASRRPLNEAIQAFKERKQQVREHSLVTAEYQRQAEAALEADKARELAEAALRDLRTQHGRCERLVRVLPLLMQYHDLQAQRAELGDVVLLSDTATAEREAAVRELREVEETLARLRSEIDGLVARRASLEIPETLLAQHAAVNRLGKSLAVWSKATADMPKVRADLEAREGEMRSALRRLGRNVPVGGLDALRVDTATQARVRKLAGDAGEVFANLRNASRARDDQRRGLARAKTEEEKARERGTIDPAPLRAVVNAARRVGDIEARLEEAQGRLREAEMTADEALARLDLFGGTLDDAVRLKAPSLTTIRRFEGSWQEFETERSRIRERLEEARRERAERDRDVEALQRAQQVPTERELDEARDRRNEGFAIVRARVEGEDTSAREQAWGEPLLDVYESTVEVADDIADRLRREADRVVQLARLQAESGERTRRIDALEHDEMDRQARAAALQEEWRAAWAEAGIAPLMPAEMREWLTRRDRLVELAAGIRTQRQEHDTLAAAVTEQRNAVAAALFSSGLPPAREDERLAALLDRAEEEVERIEEGARVHEDLARTVANLVDEVRRAEDEHEDAAKALAAWREAWGKTVGPLGLAPDATPEEATAVLDELKTLFEAERLAATARRRVEGIDRDGLRFAEEVVALAQAVAPDLAALPAESAASALLERFENARRVAEERHGIDVALETDRREAGEAELRQNAAEERLRALMTAARCDSLPSLQAAEQRSAAARALDRKVADLEAQVCAAGAASVARLEEETRGTGPDELRAQLEGLTPRVEEAEGEARRRAEEAAVAHERLRTMDGGSAAAEAEAEAHQSLARIRDLGERYVRSKLGAWLLRSAIGRYRERNQGPVVGRAGELFRRMTRGTFTGLRTDFDERDNPALRGVRADGRVLAVEGMSDGTRDQLFLALRLASLERQFATGESLPVVVDDILVQSDDLRARATLEVLGDFSERTQVLFFTHHGRLVDLARDAIPATRLRVHELG